MAFRCGFLGCGPRAFEHAKAYAHVDRGEMVAACDRHHEKVSRFCDEFNILARYADLKEMLQAENLDLVHCVTQPAARVEPMTRMADAGIPGVIVEKPVAISGADHAQLRQLQSRSDTKFAVNLQLRHHPCILDLISEVEAGAIGQVRCIDASSGLNMADQGVHTLDLMFSFNGYAQPETVFGAASGPGQFDTKHPAPETAEFMITFQNGARALLQAGDGAPRFHEGPTHQHKRIAVYGTNGFRHWWMFGYEKSLPGGDVGTGEHDYHEEDLLAQAGLTNAMLDWLEDDDSVPPTNLSNTLDEWLAILAGYASCIEGRPIDLPFDPPDDILQQLRRHCEGSAT